MSILGSSDAQSPQISVSDEDLQRILAMMNSIGSFQKGRNKGIRFTHRLFLGVKEGAITQQEIKEAHRVALENRHFRKTRAQEVGLSDQLYEDLLEHVIENFNQGSTSLEINNSFLPRLVDVARSWHARTEKAAEEKEPKEQSAKLGKEALAPIVTLLNLIHNPDTADQLKAWSMAEVKGEIVVFYSIKHKEGDGRADEKTQAEINTKIPTPFNINRIKQLGLPITETQYAEICKNLILDPKTQRFIVKPEFLTKLVEFAAIFLPQVREKKRAPSPQTPARIPGGLPMPMGIPVTSANQRQVTAFLSDMQATLKASQRERTEEKVLTLKRLFEAIDQLDYDAVVAILAQQPSLANAEEKGEFPLLVLCKRFAATKTSQNLKEEREILFLIAEELIKHKADVNKEYDVLNQPKNSALREACKNHNVKLVAWLLAKGATFKDADINDYVPVYKYHRQGGMEGVIYTSILDRDNVPLITRLLLDSKKHHLDYSHEAVLNWKSWAQKLKFTNEQNTQRRVKIERTVNLILEEIFTPGVDDFIQSLETKEAPQDLVIKAGSAYYLSATKKENQVARNINKNFDLLFSFCAALARLHQAGMLPATINYLYRLYESQGLWDFYERVWDTSEFQSIIINQANIYIGMGLLIFLKLKNIYLEVQLQKKLVPYQPKPEQRFEHKRSADQKAIDPDAYESKIDIDSEYDEEDELSLERLLNKIISAGDIIALERLLVKVPGLAKDQNGTNLLLKICQIYITIDNDSSGELNQVTKFRLQRNLLKMLRLLTQHDLDVNQLAAPLQLACNNLKAELAYFLVKKGAKFNEKNPHAYLPLEEKTEFSQEKLIPVAAIIKLMKKQILIGASSSQEARDWWQHAKCCKIYSVIKDKDVGDIKLYRDLDLYNEEAEKPKITAFFKDCELAWNPIKEKTQSAETMKAPELDIDDVCMGRPYLGPRF